MVTQGRMSKRSAIPLTGMAQSLAIGLVLLFLTHSGLAAPDASGGGSFVPAFFDLRTRIEKPDLGGIRAIRFMTDDDYPPFHFVGPDGQLTGFNVELGRLICEELKIACTIQARRWDTLLPALEQKEGDAVIASLAMTPALRQRVAFSIAYYKTPARFAGLVKREGFEITPEALTGKTIGVIAGSAHEAYLKTFFPGAVQRSFSDPDAMRLALLKQQVDFLFADAIGLAFWLNGKEAGQCCAFIGGPYTESFFFGDGVGIAMRKDQTGLKQAIDYALTKLARDGAYTTLYLKYFPIGFY